MSTISVTRFQEAEVSVIRGDDEVIIIDVLDRGVAKNLSGASVVAHIRTNVDSPDLFGEITCEDGLNGNDFAAGHIVVVIPAATFSDATQGSYVMDVETSGFLTLTVCRMRLKVIKDVTRS